MRARLALLTILATSLVGTATAQSQASAYEIIALGDTNGPGAAPHGGLVVGPDGNYYGTATVGGAFGGGTVFRLTPEGVLTSVVSFSREQGNPREALIVGSDGHLYGTTHGTFLSDLPDAQGTAFRLTLSGELTTLARFPRGPLTFAAPQKLIEASDGHLYGTTQNGGVHGWGSVFRLTKDGTLTTLLSFSQPGGVQPAGGLIEATDGNLYGLTTSGGTNDQGTVFRISKAGDFTNVANFFGGETGTRPEAELIQTPDGNFYGVTFSGTASGRGAVFRMTPAGELSGVAPLPETSLFGPSPLTLGLDGHFYGTTVDHFYRVTTSGVLTVLADFNAEFAGRTAQGPLLRLADGDFLGTTFSGGTINVNGSGTVHRLSAQGGARTVVAFPKLVGGRFMTELTEGADGQLYGTRNGGAGANPEPVVFKVTKFGVVTPLNPFSTSRRFTPDVQSSRLVAAANGELFGTVSEGGRSAADPPPGSDIRPSGFIYRIRPDGTISRLYQFMGTRGASPNEKGEVPIGGLTQGPDGHLYGTTAAGGAEARGTFFKVDVEGNLTSLASFNAATGLAPRGDLIFADGLFYGVTAQGGDNNSGTFFSVTPQGQITRIMSFPAGRSMTGNRRLVLGRNGSFYGAFATGGDNNKGSIFRLTKSGQLSTFASMNDATGSGPLGVVEAGDGNFFGVTTGLDGQGALFRIDRAGVVTALVKFESGNGTHPIANLIQASDGHLYGTTASGGAARAGVVYRLNMPPPPQLLNISTRLRVDTGENVLIGGFIVTGNQPKKVIVRAIGPSLQQAGVAGTLANPVLELRGGGGTAIATNDDWRTTQEGEIQASGVAPGNDLEAAIVATLQPGDYTAIVSGANSTTGVAVVEAYDLEQTSESKLANISTRGLVGLGEDVMIAGVITGQAKVIVRALGPSLQQSGISNAIGDPTLELRDGNGELIIGNNNWKDDPAQAAQIQTSGIPPQHDLESAVAVTLPAGPSTAVVRGQGETIGVGLVEVYNIP